MDATTADRNRVELERRITELEQRLERLAAEQAEALAALHKAERRRGSLAYRLAAELRARLGSGR